MYHNKTTIILSTRWSI